MPALPFALFVTLGLLAPEPLSPPPQPVAPRPAAAASSDAPRAGGATDVHVIVGEDDDSAGAAEAAPPVMDAADSVVAGLDDHALAALCREALVRSPRLAAARAEADAMAQGPTLARALPDPMVSATAWVAQPVDDMGRDLGMIMLSQAFPGPGKRRLAADAATHDAEASRLDVEAQRLALVTSVRRTWLELASLGAEDVADRDERAALAALTSVAQARQAAGTARLVEGVALESEAARMDDARLELARSRQDLLADLASSLGRSTLDVAGLADARGQLDAGTPLTGVGGLSRQDLLARAEEIRPDLHAAQARVDAASSRVALARAARRPDFSLGLELEAMSPSRDMMTGKVVPGSGMDNAAVTGSVTLPVHERRIAAGIQQETLRREAARSQQQDAVADVSRRLDQLLQRAALDLSRVALEEGTLSDDAAARRRAAEIAFSSGSEEGTQPLMEAVRLVFDLRRDAAHTRADLLIALAELEGEVGAPLSAPRRAMADAASDGRSAEPGGSEAFDGSIGESPRDIGPPLGAPRQAAEGASGRLPVGGTSEASNGTPGKAPVDPERLGDIACADRTASLESMTEVSP